MTFGIVWIILFCLSSSKFAIIVTAAMWFFSANEDQLPAIEKHSHTNALLGLKLSWRYHFGSLAKGSLFNAIAWCLQTVRDIIMELSNNSLENRPLLRFMYSILRFLICNLDFMLTYVNESAYIEMALTGQNFTDSCKSSKYLTLKYQEDYYFTSGIGALYGFIGKSTICLLNSALVYYMLESWA